MRLTDFFLVLPTFVLAIILAPVILDIIGVEAEIAGLRATLVVIVIVIGITSWATTARIIRSQTMSIRSRMFVDRARVIGAGQGHIMRRHIFPNVVNLIVAQAVITFAAAVFIETSLSFIGLGDPFSPSWGQLLDSAQSTGRAGPRRVVVHRPAGRLRRPRRARLHARRERARRHPQPEVGDAAMTDPREELRLAGELRDEDVAAIQDPEAAREAEVLAQEALATESAARTARLGDAVDLAAIRGRRQWPLPKQADPGAPLLVVKDLRTHFKLESGWVKAVDGVSFRLNDGEALGLAGESGCGKTTTALSLVRLLPPNARIRKGSSIELFGIDLVPKTEDQLRRYRWREISIVFQGAMNALNPVRRVGEQIAEPIEIRLGDSKEHAKQRAGELLELVGIPRKRAGAYPHELSGGMRQRAMIAMALACDPALVIGDEPTTALDVMVQAQILELLERLRRELGLSLILITHDLSVIAETCDRTLIMYAGKVAEEGPVRGSSRRRGTPTRRSCSARSRTSTPTAAASTRSPVAARPPRSTDRLPVPPALSRRRWTSAARSSRPRSSSPTASASPATSIRRSAAAPSAGRRRSPVDRRAAIPAGRPRRRGRRPGSRAGPAADAPAAAHPRPRPVTPAPPRLEGLEVHFPIRAASSTRSRGRPAASSGPSTGSTSTIRAGRGPRPGRRVGVRQDHDRPGHRQAHPADRGTDRLRRRGRRARCGPPRRCAATAGGSSSSSRTRTRR